ncbi:MAG: alkaline phosphatase D family protein [Bacteroidia bacterium]|nr:alkaline phosphatase D family protein [Bacteroidia bacterium]
MKNLPFLLLFLLTGNLFAQNYHLLLSGGFSTAHLSDSNGRVLHTWHNREAGEWKYAEISPEGNLQVVTQSGEWLSLNWHSQAIKRKKAPASLLKKAQTASYAPGKDEFEEVTMVADLPEAQTETWLSHHQIPPPYTPVEIKQEKREITLDGQYKKLNRETISEIEVGYWQNADNYLNDFLALNPNDLEGLFARTLLLTRRGNLPEATKIAREAVQKGLRPERFLSNLNGLFDPLLQYEDFRKFVDSMGVSRVLHGPTLGNKTAESISVWLRTNGPADVFVKVLNPATREEITRSETVRTNAEHEFTGKLSVHGLQASNAYLYQVFVEGKQAGGNYSFTTAPEKGEKSAFSIGFAGGAGYTPWFERMWDTLNTHNLSAFLLMGDNVYIDHPERPATQQYCYYRRQSRPEFRRFASATPLYAIWDDHDFTYNDERGGPEINTPYWKKDVLKLFQNQWINPYFGGGEMAPGCYFDFSMGDVDFIMLDCRYYREDPEQTNPSMLGAIQKEWLKEKLKSSKGTFKVLASSVPWAKDTKPGSLDTWDGYSAEREEIFSFIESEKIEGVILLSADRHRSDAWHIERPDGYGFYEFMSSKLTNVHTHKVMPTALFGYNKTCSFGQLDFDTKRDDPQVMYRIFNIENEEIHRITVYLSQLQIVNSK